MKKQFFSLVVIISILLIISNTVFTQKLKVEEIIQKHLESIGTKEKRSSLKNYFAVGISQFASKLPDKKTAGKIVIVSDANNFFYSSSFNSKEYPFEKIGLFTGDIS